LFLGEAVAEVGWEEKLEFLDFSSWMEMGYSVDSGRFGFGFVSESKTTMTEFLTIGKGAPRKYCHRGVKNLRNPERGEVGAVGMSIVMVSADKYTGEPLAPINRVGDSNRLRLIPTFVQFAASVALHWKKRGHKRVRLAPR
jgi:hypothetical protein